MPSGDNDHEPRRWSDATNIDEQVVPVHVQRFVKAGVLANTLLVSAIIPPLSITTNIGKMFKDVLRYMSVRRREACVEKWEAVAGCVMRSVRTGER